MTAYDVNQAAEFITKSILFTLYTYVPLKQSFNSNSTRKTPWFNQELRCLVRKRTRLFNKTKKSKLNEDQLAYNKIRNLLQRKITEAKINQNKLCKSFSNCSPSLFWKTVKSFDLSKNKTNSHVDLVLKATNLTIITDNLKKADLFNLLLFAENSTLSDSEYLAQLP